MYARSLLSKLTRDDDIVVRLLKKFQMGFGRKLDQHLLQREKYRPVFVGTEGRRSIIEMRPNRLGSSFDEAQDGADEGNVDIIS